MLLTSVLRTPQVMIISFYHERRGISSEYSEYLVSILIHRTRPFLAHKKGSRITPLPKIIQFTPITVSKKSIIITADTLRLGQKLHYACCQI